MWIKTSSGERPKDDETVLVCWLDEEGKYSSPHRAYYLFDRFFSLENLNSHPIVVDIYMEIPDPNATA